METQIFAVHQNSARIQEINSFPRISIILPESDPTTTENPT
jgi:hypothetical protein